MSMSNRLFLLCFWEDEENIRTKIEESSPPLYHSSVVDDEHVRIIVTHRPARLVVSFDELDCQSFERRRAELPKLRHAHTAQFHCSTESKICDAHDTLLSRRIIAWLDKILIGTQKKMRDELDGSACCRRPPITTHIPCRQHATRWSCARSRQ